MAALVFMPDLRRHGEGENRTLGELGLKGELQHCHAVSNRGEMWVQKGPEGPVRHAEAIRRLTRARRRCLRMSLALACGSKRTEITDLAVDSASRTRQSRRGTKRTSDVPDLIDNDVGAINAVERYVVRDVLKGLHLD